MANELHFTWPSLSPPHLADDDRLGVALLANLMAAPEQAYQDRVGTAQMRQVARSMGVPEDQLNRIMPGEDNPQPVGGTGVMGKIMSGVSKTGATLASILGAPVKPPRFGPTEIKDLEEGSAKESLIGTLDRNDPDYAKKAAKIRLGKFDEVFPGAPKNLIELVNAESDRRGLTGRDAYDFKTSEYGRLAGVQTGARVDATDRAKQQNAHDAAIEWNKNHTNPNEQVPVPPAPSGDGGTTEPGSGMGGQGHYGRMSLPDDPVAPGKISAYDKRITAAEDKYGHPRGLLSALFENESNFDPNATGPPIPSMGGIRARGIAQFIDPTAKQFGIDPTNADQSIDAAGKYLRQLKDQYGDYHTALLAYGGGLKSGNYPAGAILQRAAQYREAMAGRAPGGAVGPEPAGPVLANYPNAVPERVRDLQSRVQTGAITQQQMDDELRNEATDPYAGQRGPVQVARQPEGMVGQPPPGTQYAEADTGVVTDAAGRPIGTAVPVAPGGGTVLQPTKKEIDTGAGKITYTDPELAKRNPEIMTKGRIMFGTSDLTNEQLQQAEDAVRQEKITGRPLTSIDLALYATGNKPGVELSRDQADDVVRYLQKYKNDPGLNGQLARAKIAEIWLKRLTEPVRQIDPKTADYVIDPRTGQPKNKVNPDGTPMRAIDALATDPIAASIPIFSAGYVEWKRRSGDEAASLLEQAQAGLTNLAKALGETGRVPVQEQQRLKGLIPVPGEDTVASAAVKVKQATELVQNIQRELVSQGGNEKGARTPQEQQEQNIRQHGVHVPEGWEIMEPQ